MLTFKNILRHVLLILKRIIKAKVTKLNKIFLTVQMQYKCNKLCITQGIYLLLHQ